MRDFFEMKEDSCEQWVFDNVKGDQFTCCCGNTCKLSTAQTISPDPYAIPVCGECFDKSMDDKFGMSWRDKM